MRNQPLGRLARLLLLTLATGAWLALPGDAVGQDGYEAQVRRQWQDFTDKGKYNEAEKVARQALQMAEARKDEASAIYWLHMLGHTFRSQKNYADAEDVFKAVLNANLKAFGTDAVNVAEMYIDLAWLDKDRRRFPSAEANFKKSLEILDRVSATRDINLNYTLDGLVDLYIAYLGRPADALPLARRLLALNEALEGPESDSVARALGYIGLAYQDLGHPAEGDAPLSRALTIYKKRYGPEHENTLTTLIRVANGAESQGRYGQAEEILRKLLAIYEKAPGPEAMITETCLVRLSTVCISQAKYTEGEVLARRAAAAAEKAEGPESLNLAMALYNLGLSSTFLQKYAAAEAPFRRALAIREKALGAESPLVARSLRDLGVLYSDLSRHVEAEPLLKRALAIYEKSQAPASRGVVETSLGLGSLYTTLGRFSDAEPHLRRAVEIRRKSAGESPLELVNALNTMARWAQEQRRDEEARAILAECVAILEKIKPERYELAYYRERLAALDLGRMNPEERLASLRKTVADVEKRYGPRQSYLAYRLRALARELYERGEFAEAATHFRRSLGILQIALGTNHLDVAMDVKDLAACYARLGKVAEGEPLAERAVAMVDRLGASPQLRGEAYHIRALLAWQAKRRSEALADMEKALDLIETARNQASGTGVERATFFASFDYLYDEMITFQFEQGDVHGLFRTSERAHARSLLEEFSVAGTDLDLGRPAEERDRLRARERELTSAISSLEKRIADGSNDPGLAGELNSARDRLYEHYREVRASSPILQGLLSNGGGPVRLSTLQRKLLTNAGAMVVYHVGNRRSFAVLADETGQVLAELKLDEATARTLGVEPGPLSAAKIQQALVNAEGTGVVQMLSDRARSIEATPKLAALWQAVIPDALKKPLLARRIQLLLVVPDGPLALLPFEALVVEPGDDPKYLLDIGPPITYGPSASVLANLADRPSRRMGPEPILTVGDPVYSSDELVAVAQAAGPKTRFGAGGGRLPRLPFTAREVDWIAKGAVENKLKVAALLGPKATEAAVRAAVAGRTYVHLACHGLSDPAHGNFYGSLALTPGPKAGTDPDDDGFLTLTEIYRLNLSSCEVGVLSACNTNFGPQQKGEGVWAVSRGFLVAGARRVVASNWLVDDEAAASLISLFLTETTKPRPIPPPANAPKGTAPKFNRLYPSLALQRAKQWVRHQDSWKAPYYWASFVQIGPH